MDVDSLSTRGGVLFHLLHRRGTVPSGNHNMSGRQRRIRQLRMRQDASERLSEAVAAGA
jgi:hypothetical protein